MFPLLSRAVDTFPWGPRYAYAISASAETVLFEGLAVPDEDDDEDEVEALLFCFELKTSPNPIPPTATAPAAPATIAERFKNLRRPGFGFSFEFFDTLVAIGYFLEKQDLVFRWLVSLCFPKYNTCRQFIVILSTLSGSGQRSDGLVSGVLPNFPYGIPRSKK